MLIEIACAIATFVATIVLGVAQYRQGKRMEKLALRQDQDEKLHREQRVRAQRDAFIIKYNNPSNDIYLLPLCWISSMYNPTMSYCREMYREYNMLEQEVQDAICEYMNLVVDKPQCKGTEFYGICADALQKAEHEYLPFNDNKIYFYENAKYLERSITRYASSRLPDLYEKAEACFGDYLTSYAINGHFFPNPINCFMREFGLSARLENEACLLCAVAAKGIALDKAQEDDSSKYWIPGQHANERLETMEDLFLCALFCVYVGLLIQGENNDE